MPRGIGSPNMWGPRVWRGGAGSPRLVARRVIWPVTVCRVCAMLGTPQASSWSSAAMAIGTRPKLVLTDVVAAGAGQVLIGVVDQRGEVLRAVSQDPVLLEWPAVKVLVGNVEVADAERAQQPLVADSNDEVWLQGREIDLHRAEGLAGVDDECRAGIPDAGDDGVQVDQRAVGPVDVGGTATTAVWSSSLSRIALAQSWPGSRGGRPQVQRRIAGWRAARCSSSRGIPRRGPARGRSGPAAGCGRRWQARRWWPGRGPRGAAEVCRRRAARPRRASTSRNQSGGVMVQGRARTSRPRRPASWTLCSSGDRLAVLMYTTSSGTSKRWRWLGSSVAVFPVSDGPGGRGDRHGIEDSSS